MAARILAFETSCDETAAAVVEFNEKQTRLLSSSVYSQVDLHREYGGVVPELASRSHVEKIVEVSRRALVDAGIEEPDYIAVTNRPGLAGALLVGLCFAKGIALALGKRLIPVDHLKAHVHSVRILGVGKEIEDLDFPHLGLVVSGGHTSFFLMRGPTEGEEVGRTLDDAAGEALDKISKLLGFGYPGGPVIERLAEKTGFKTRRIYPRPMADSGDLNFSFSGLKTAVLYDAMRRGILDSSLKRVRKASDEEAAEIASELLNSVVDVIEKKLLNALKEFGVRSFSVSGGVSCNSLLRERAMRVAELTGVRLFLPPKKFSGDNAAMVGVLAAELARREVFGSLRTGILDQGEL